MKSYQPTEGREMNDIKQSTQSRIDQALAEVAETADIELARQHEQDGINKFFTEGKPELAMDEFMAALRAAGPDQDQRARCLGNIGDLARRTETDPATAMAIFEQARSLEMSNLTESRLLSMEAMVWMFRTEQGDVRPKEIEQALKLLEDAILTARTVQLQDQQVGIQAESLATHRLAAVVCNYPEVCARIDSDIIRQTQTAIEELLRKLPFSDSAEIARLNYSRAMLMANTNRPEAIDLMLESANAIQDFSDVDACYYFAVAGRWLVEEGRIDEARHCYRQAGECIQHTRVHANAGRIIDAYAQLGQMLGE